MTPDIVPPFLSLEFHTRFFPRLLGDRLRRKNRAGRSTGFTSTMEMMIMFAVCLILAIIGIPSAWTQGSVVGWILTIIGVGGLIGLVIVSVGSQWGDRPTYDDFLTGIFLFFVSLGAFIGIPLGMDRHSFWLGVSASLAGLVAGYVIGILAGLRLQHLGWLAVIINMMAAFGAIVMGGTMLVMLVVLIVQ